ncbi:MAG: nucleotidyltransferase family protein [Nitrososphaeria archaeon]
MKALVLAGGFAKRLWPLTIDRPKPLLPVAGRPIIDYMIDKLDEVGVQEITISTNMKFKLHFERWLSDIGRNNVKLAVEESRSEKEKLGAVKALAKLASEMVGDCIIAAGDNLFTGSLRGMVEKYRRLSSPVIGLYDVRDFELAKSYSTVVVDSNFKISEFIEKPDNPKTTLIGTCLYILPESSLQRVGEYVQTGLDTDAPGRFIQWLCVKESVYGFLLEGMWWDIGTIRAYNEAKRYFSNLSR